ncbi:MAG: FAD-binding oxidoreductase, partial [Dehalococcoidia bacterium]|nr:FAD-binding oxidoreductase [Dehalococcoidia bacterium]
MAKKQEFNPQWCEQVAPPRSFRSLFKYGDPAGFKHPNTGMYRLLKDIFSMTDDDFKQPSLTMKSLDIEIPVSLAGSHIEALTKLAGSGNVSMDTYDRVRASYGGAMIDDLRLRAGIVENLPDMVITPLNREDIICIVSYCDDQRIPVYVSGGGSS